MLLTSIRLAPVSCEVYPVKGSIWLIEQQALPSLFSTDCFQESSWAWLTKAENWTNINEYKLNNLIQTLTVAMIKYIYISFIIKDGTMGNQSKRSVAIETVWHIWLIKSKTQNRKLHLPRIHFLQVQRTNTSYLSCTQRRTETRDFYLSVSPSWTPILSVKDGNSTSFQQCTVVEW